MAALRILSSKKLILFSVLVALTLLECNQLFTLWHYSQVFGDDDRARNEPQPETREPQQEESASLGSVVKLEPSSVGEFKKREAMKKVTVYMYPASEMTWELVNREESQEYAERFYSRNLNEHSAEIWLHRGFQKLLTEGMGRINVKRETETDGSRIIDTVSPQIVHTVNPSEADIFLIPAYLHLSLSVPGHKERIQSFIHSILNIASSSSSNSGNSDTQKGNNNSAAVPIADRPHLFLCPTTNPELSRKIGVKPIINELNHHLSRLYSVGFERNTFWQGLPPERIVVVPYVVHVTDSWSTLRSVLVVSEPLPKTTTTATDTTTTAAAAAASLLSLSNLRRNNSIFYVANNRPNAIKWGGCNRSMVNPLRHEKNMYISLTAKLSPMEFRSHMVSTEYCLITCGDTPTSRRLIDAMVYGCIPVFIGTRLLGLCESPPCQHGWGWTLSGRNYTHLPFDYPDMISWTEIFPVLDEMNFSKAPLETIQHEVFDVYTTLEQKNAIRHVMADMQLAFVYGRGSPLKSNDFGDAIFYIWKTFYHHYYDSSLV